ncbi:uncharacterized protein LOC133832783 [Humulus lupulus]|uniref:uncharacterized protein LOC133832783 n=1 Tax=Humulus lupulus TaxID=3486 RepID=UPI002B40B12C|nr:uncharacterized protein LOC133832783 [Humulus lupulus]
MEYCTRLLQQASMDKGLRFHPKCKHLKIVNLCFAYDLVIFCKGVNSSVQIIKESFNAICCASGLTTNKDKSQIYFGGVAEKETQKLLEGLQFSEGHFPLKYLGVPLRTTRWKVCLPKFMGGLGFKDSCTWNKVLLAKYIWDVSSKHDILWVKWVDSIYLKGQDLWLYRVPQDVSWYWRRLTKLRDDFPAFRLDEAVHHNNLCLKILYHRLLNKDRVIFANVVWNSLTVPKHRFVLWQATLGHLLTRDKLSLCHLDLPSVLCPVCEEEQESHCHLFFECPFSRQVRSQVESWLGSGIWPSHLEGWCSWMAGKPKGLKQVVMSAALAASVYMVWRNRNNCIFKFSSFSVGSVTNLIKHFVRGRLLSHTKKNLRKHDLAFFDKVVQM